MDNRNSLNESVLFADEEQPMEYQESDDSSADEDYSAFDDESGPIEFRAINSDNWPQHTPRTTRPIVFILKRILICLLMGPLIISLFFGLKRLFKPSHSRHRSQNHFFGSSGTKRHSKSIFFSIPLLFLLFLSFIVFTVFCYFFFKRRNARNIDSYSVRSVGRTPVRSHYSSDEISDEESTRRRFGRQRKVSTKKKRSSKRRSRKVSPKRRVRRRAKRSVVSVVQT